MFLRTHNTATQNSTLYSSQLVKSQGTSDSDLWKPPLCCNVM